MRIIDRKTMWSMLFSKNGVLVHVMLFAFIVHDVMCAPAKPIENPTHYVCKDPTFMWNKPEKREKHCYYLMAIYSDQEAFTVCESLTMEIDKQTLTASTLIVDGYIESSILHEIFDAFTKNLPTAIKRQLINPPVVLGYFDERDKGEKFKFMRTLLEWSGLDKHHCIHYSPDIHVYEIDDCRASYPAGTFALAPCKIGMNSLGGKILEAKHGVKVKPSTTTTTIKPDKNGVGNSYGRSIFWWILVSVLFCLRFLSV